ncbi:MAG: ABC transporter permease [Bacillota bacterium]
MYRYIIRRLLAIIPVLIGASFLVFSAVRLAPGDPARTIVGESASAELVEQVRKEMGLDKPLLTQYAVFATRALSGHLGKSLRTNDSVARELADKLPNTLKLTVAALTLAAIAGVGAGVVAATRRNSVFDNTSMVISLLGVSMPVFWLGFLLMLLFSITLPKLLGTGPLLPPTGAGTWKHLIMPSITLAAYSTGIIARMTRSSMLEVLQKDFIRTARAKGLADRAVIYKHALRNALVPVVTIMGLQVGTLLGGAVLTETVFSWPGVGGLLVNGILFRDYPVVQGTVLFITCAFVLVNLFVDLLYAVLDPRIRYN